MDSASSGRAMQGPKTKFWENENLQRSENEEREEWKEGRTRHGRGLTIL